MLTNSLSLSPTINAPTPAFLQGSALEKQLGKASDAILPETLRPVDNVNKANIQEGKDLDIGAPFLLHETLGCPIANLHSAWSDLWEPQFVLRPTQLRKKHCFVKSTSNDLTAVGITTCLPSELTSSLRIGEFPCRLLRTKNHHFAALRFPDFQRKVNKILKNPPQNQKIPLRIQINLMMNSPLKNKQSLNNYSNVILKLKHMSKPTLVRQVA